MQINTHTVLIKQLLAVSSLYDSWHEGVRENGVVLQGSVKGCVNGNSQLQI